MPAYQQVEDPDKWLCYNIQSDKNWMVQTTEHKGATRGFARTVGGRDSTPWEPATSWLEGDGKGLQAGCGVEARPLRSADEVESLAFLESSIAISRTWKAKLGNDQPYAMFGMVVASLPQWLRVVCAPIFTSCNAYSI